MNQSTELPNIETNGTQLKVSQNKLDEHPPIISQPKRVEISTRTGKPKRRKAVRACTNCQRTHLTCDDNRPCERCIKRGCESTCQDGIRKKLKPTVSSAYSGNRVTESPTTTRAGVASTGQMRQPFFSKQPSIENMLFPAVPQNGDDIYASFGYSDNPQNGEQTSQAIMYTNGISGSSEIDIPFRNSLGGALTFVSTQSDEKLSNSAPSGSEIIRLQKPYKNSHSYYDSFSTFTHSSRNAYPEHHKYPHHHHRHSTSDIEYSSSFETEGIENFGSDKRITDSDLGRQNALMVASNRDINRSVLGNSVAAGLNNHEIHGSTESEMETNPDLVRNSYGAFVKQDDSSYYQPNVNTSFGSNSAHPLEESTTAQNANQTLKHRTHPLEHLQCTEALESSSSNEDNVDKKEPIFAWMNLPPNPLAAAHNEHSTHLSYGYEKMDPSEVYSHVTEPYPYKKAMREMLKCLQKKLAEDDFNKLSRTLSRIRKSFYYIHKSLSNEDQIFIEQSFQRSILEEEKQFALISVPCLVWRWTGQIAAVSPRFSKLLDATPEELKKLSFFEILDNASIMHYFAYTKTFTQTGFLPEFKFDCVLTSEKVGNIMVAAEVTIRRDLFNMPLTILGKFWVK